MIIDSAHKWLTGRILPRVSAEADRMQRLVLGEGASPEQADLVTRHNAAIDGIEADDIYAEAEKEAWFYLFVGLGLLSALVVAVVFLLALLGPMPWPWLSAAVGLLGLGVDIAGVVILTFDAMELTERVVMNAPDGTAYWSSDIPVATENRQKMRAYRHGEVRKLWQVPRIGLTVIVCGFLLQAASQAISLGAALRPPSAPVAPPGPAATTAPAPPHGAAPTLGQSTAARRGVVHGSRGPSAHTP